MRASYLILLFEALKSNGRVSQNMCHSGLINTSPAPNRSPVDDPSTKSSQGLSFGGSPFRTLLNSVMKSVRAWPSMEVWGIYHLLNYSSSIAHFAIRPEVFVLCKVCVNGKLVRTLMGSSKKYGLKFRAASIGHIPAFLQANDRAWHHRVFCSRNRSSFGLCSLPKLGRHWWRYLK